MKWLNWALIGLVTIGAVRILTEDGARPAPPPVRTEAPAPVPYVPSGQAFELPALPEGFDLNAIETEPGRTHKLEPGMAGKDCRADRAGEVWCAGVVDMLKL